MYLGLAVLLHCSFAESFVQFQEQLKSFSWYRFRTVQREELNSAKPGLQPQSEQAPPSPQHGLPPPSTPVFPPRRVVDMQIWAQRWTSARPLSTLGIEAGGSQTSCPPRLHSEAISQKLRKETTCRQLLPSRFVLPPATLS